MTVDTETLIAYIDGELDAVTAKRVERAIEADPALRAEMEQHRALTQSLHGAFAPIAQAPVPDAVTQLLRDSAKVTAFPAATAVKPARPWRWVGAVAASLAIGLFAGQMLPRTAGESGLAMKGGALVAQSDVARALDTQLASTQGASASVRIGVTFRDQAGRLCRSFEQAATAGIACAAKGEGWTVARLREAAPAQASDYRQASSQSIMADAQAMMAGEPMDAEAEKAAIANRH